MLFCRMMNSHFTMVEIRFPNISPPKTQIVDLFCFTILIFTVNRNKIPQGKCEFLSTQCFKNVN